MPLFLQGSTDYGGSNIFVVTVALYVWFGLTGAAWLALVSHVGGARSSFARGLAANIRRMRFHLLLFLLLRVMTWSPWTSAQDRDPDLDFRSIFVLVVFLYAGSFLLVTWLSRQTLPLAEKVISSPLMLWLWLVIAADGSTPKAGQMLRDL